MKISRLCLFLAATLGSTLASADVLVDRGLPNTTHANGGPAGPSDPDRSNVNWANQDGFINGDSFLATGDWAINKISTWMVGDSSLYSDYTLWGGVNGVDFGIISTTFTITREYYLPENPLVSCNNAGLGADYLNTSGTGCFPINKITFDVNLSLANGTLYNFAPDAVPTGPCEVGGNVSGCFYVHAANKDLAGTPQQGSDNLYISFDPAADPLLPPGDPFPIDSDNGIDWDKSSDINVRVEGSVVPEPSTIPIILTGIVAIGVLRRRRK